MSIGSLRARSIGHKREGKNLLTAPTLEIFPGSNFTGIAINTQRKRQFLRVCKKEQRSSQTPAQGNNEQPAALSPGLKFACNELH